MHSLQFLLLNCEIINQYEKYTASFEQKILEEYRPEVHGSGFKSVAKRFKIKDDHQLIKSWYRQWDGSVQSLHVKQRTDRPRKLTTEEMKRYILNFVETMNDPDKPVNYKMVQAHVQASLNRKGPLAAMKRYGRMEYGIKSLISHEITSRDSVYTVFYKENIIVQSRRLRVHRTKLLYL